ncbi:MAG TPA: NUDIX hydrolase [Candidatus Hydrogenedentes bacterium]|nr:NUDIX hydrolase [Candidatus Hydrogenedentota bacterium]HOS03098.1 NUDIX hydrolase [Candidatus Hydrogenedentota bacterium]
MEIWKRSEVVYTGRIVTLRTGAVTLDDGSLAQREVVEHNGGVGVVPYHDGKVILVRQFRIAVGHEVLELPAGCLEGDEDPAYRAARELEEETGHRAGRLLPMGRYYCSPGFTNEADYLFLALDLVKTEQALEFDERLELVEMSLADVRKGLETCGFHDMKTALGLRLLLDYLARM